MRLSLFAAAVALVPAATPADEWVFDRRLTELERRMDAVERRLASVPSAAAGPQVVHPVGTVGRTADGTEVVCTPNGWQATTASRSYGFPGDPVWSPFATQAPVQPLTTAIGAGGFTTTCGPNGCSNQPVGFSNGGLIRRSLGLFR